MPEPKTETAPPESGAQIAAAEAAEARADGAQAAALEAATRAAAAGPAPTAPIRMPPPAAMPYLGTLAPPGLRQAQKKVGVASLPCVVLNGDGVPLGVVVASNPGFLGQALEPLLAEAGLEGPFTQVPPTRLDDAGKLSAARAIMRASDPQLDKIGALASFGYNPKMLA